MNKRNTFLSFNFGIGQPSIFFGAKLLCTVDGFLMFSADIALEVHELILLVLLKIESIYQIIQLKFLCNNKHVIKRTYDAISVSFFVFICHIIYN